MEQQQQKQAVLTTAVPSSAFGLAAGNKASSTNTDDKENIDPGMDQPHPAGFSAKQFGDKAGPTKFGRSKGGQGSRAPLTDITSLFMLQVGGHCSCARLVLNSIVGGWAAHTPPQVRLLLLTRPQHRWTTTCPDMHTCASQPCMPALFWLLFCDHAAWSASQARPKTTTWRSGGTGEEDEGVVLGAGTSHHSHTHVHALSTGAGRF